MTRMVRLKPLKVNSGTLNRDRTFSEKSYLDTEVITPIRTVIKSQNALRPTML
jgi:hypothetical protein